MLFPSAPSPVSMQNIEYKGYWWFPGEKTDKVGGTVTYYPESGIRLDLFDILETSDDSSSKGANRYNRLLGESKDGTSITLLNLSSSSRHYSSSSWMSYQAKRMLVGPHFPNNHHISFDKIRVSFPLMEEWTARESVNGDNPRSS